MKWLVFITKYKIASYEAIATRQAFKDFPLMAEASSVILHTTWSFTAAGVGGGGGVAHCSQWSLPCQHHGQCISAQLRQDGGPSCWPSFSLKRTPFVDD
jgi:hypothetical protein